MTGIIDVGGANRAVFADGVFDSLLDNDIILDYCIGVSAGAANCASYIAGQRGRNLEFYTNYNFSSHSIGLLAWLKTGGSFIDLDYIYGTLSNHDGKSPLDYDAMMRSPTVFKIVATDSEMAEPVYFDKTVMRQDDYRVIRRHANRILITEEPILTAMCRIRFRWSERLRMAVTGLS